MQRYALGQRLAVASAGGCGDSMFAATSTGSQADTFARPCNLSIPAPETKSDDAGGVLEGTGFQDVDPNSLGWDDEDDADDELSLVQSLYGAFFQPSELTNLRREFYKTASSGMMTIKDAEDLFITAQFMVEHAVQEENLVRNLHLALANTRTVCMLIRKAEGVVSKDSNGLSDPFAVVLVDGKPSHSSVNGGKAYGQTQVVYKTLGVCVCVCVCVLHACVRACVHAACCVSARLRLRVYVHTTFHTPQTRYVTACACVCVRARATERAHACVPRFAGTC